MPMAGMQMFTYSFSKRIIKVIPAIDPKIQSQRTKNIRIWVSWLHITCQIFYIKKEQIPSIGAASRDARNIYFSNVRFQGVKIKYTIFEDWSPIWIMTLIIFKISAILFTVLLVGIPSQLLSVNPTKFWSPLTITFSSTILYHRDSISTASYCYSYT